MLKLAYCIMNREINYANRAGCAPFKRIALLLAEVMALACRN